MLGDLQKPSASARKKPVVSQRRTKTNKTNKQQLKEQEDADFELAVKQSLESFVDDDDDRLAEHLKQLDEYARVNNLVSLDELVSHAGDCGFDSLELMRNGFGGTVNDWKRNKEKRSQKLRIELGKALRQYASNEVQRPPFTDKAGIITYEMLGRRGSERRNGEDEPLDQYINAMNRPGEYMEGAILLVAPLVLRRPITIVMSTWSKDRPLMPVFVQTYQPKSLYAHRRPVIMALQNTKRGPHFSPLVHESDSRFTTVPTDKAAKSIELLLDEFVGGSGGSLHAELTSTPRPRALEAEYRQITSTYSAAVDDDSRQVPLPGDHATAMFDLLCRSRFLTAEPGVAGARFNTATVLLETRARDYLENRDRTPREALILDLTNLDGHSTATSTSRSHNNVPQYRDAEEALLFAAVCQKMGALGDAYRVYKRMARRTLKAAGSYSSSSSSSSSNSSSSSSSSSSSDGDATAQFGGQVGAMSLSTSADTRTSSLTPSISLGQPTPGPSDVSLAQESSERAHVVQLVSGLRRINAICSEILREFSDVAQQSGGV